MNCPNCQRPFVRARRTNTAIEVTHVDGTVCMTLDASVLELSPTAIPVVTDEQFRLLERAANDRMAACEVLAPLLKIDAQAMCKAANLHGMRAVLVAAGLLAK